MKFNFVVIKHCLWIFCVIVLLINEDCQVKCDEHIDKYNGLVEFGFKSFNIIQTSVLSNVSTLYSTLTELSKSNLIVQEAETKRENFTLQIINNIDNCFSTILIGNHSEFLRSQIIKYNQLHFYYENNFMKMLECLSNNSTVNFTVAKHLAKYNIGGRKEYLDGTLYLSFICELEFAQEFEGERRLCGLLFRPNELVDSFPFLMLNYIKTMTMILFNLKYLDNDEYSQLYQHFLMEEYQQTLRKIYNILIEGSSDPCRSH